MPSPFDITVASNTVNLDNNRTGVAAFTVKNNTRRHVHASARVSTQPPDGAKWLTILPPDGSSDPANTRDFPIDGTQQFAIKIAVPLDAAPASYTIKLTVADEVNPDDNFTDAPDVVFTVREIPKPAPRPFPVWIIPAIVIALLVIVAIIVVGVTSANNANANATGTAVALLDARNLADTATANAVLNATATEVAAQQTAAAQTAVAQTQAAATQTALNVFVGTWAPVDSANSGTLGAMNISDAGSNRVNISYVSNCPPAGNLCLSVASTYTINNVPFNPSQLVAGIGATTLLIQPANGGTLGVRIGTGGFTTLVTMQRHRIINPFPNVGLVVTSAAISQFQLNQLIIAPTKAP